MHYFILFQKVSTCIHNCNHNCNHLMMLKHYAALQTALYIKITTEEGQVTQSLFALWSLGWVRRGGSHHVNALTLSSSPPPSCQGLWECWRSGWGVGRAMSGRGWPLNQTEWRHSTARCEFHRGPPNTRLDLTGTGTPASTDPFCIRDNPCTECAIQKGTTVSASDTVSDHARLSFGALNVCSKATRCCSGQQVTANSMQPVISKKQIRVSEICPGFLLLGLCGFKFEII